MKVKSESEVAQSYQTLATPWTAAYQAPPSMGFSRQKYWSGVPLPSPDTLLDLVRPRSMDKLLFPFMDFMNKAAMNISAQVLE